LTNHIIRQEKSAQRRNERFWFAFSQGVLRRTHIRSHPRLFAATAVGVFLYWFMSGRTGPGEGFLVAFDGGALTFLTAVWVMMVRATPDSMRRRAEIEDEGRYTVLIFGTAAASAVLLAIVFELHSSKNADAPGLHIVLAATTILLSWFFRIRYSHCITPTVIMVMPIQPANIKLSGVWCFPVSRSLTIGISCTFRA
jgi:hypothetical protein